MRKLYGVVVKCDRGCEHLVSLDKDYFEAWRKAGRYGMLDSARTVRIDPEDKIVREFEKRKMSG